MTAMVNCDQAAEYVSALVDGETIPRDAADHIGGCAPCRGRVNDYIAMGAELRRVASVEMDAAVPALRIEKRRTTRSLWQKGLETMRIPKFAFALLVLAVVGLASSLTIVKVGAHSSGSVLMLHVMGPGADKPWPCAIDTTVRKGPPACSLMGDMNHSMAGLQFQVLARDGDKVQLGVRSKAVPMGNAGTYSMTLDAFVAGPQEQYWFEPGETLKLDIQNAGTVEITGEWMDHMPSLVGESHLDPGPDELRFVSPLLLEDNKVLGDMEGGTSIAPDPNMGIMIHFEGSGRYLISLSPMKDAVEGQVRLNRVAFQMGGQKFVFLTGAPVTRRDRVWVRYEPDFRPTAGEERGFIGSGKLSQIAPDAVLPSKAPAS